MAFLLFLALLPYAGILHNDFTYIYDDKAQILDNPYVHTFGHLREVFTTPVWSFADAHGMTNYYRPVMTFGFLICYQIFGPLAFGFHLASLLLHAAVVMMLYLFAERLFRHRGAAFAVAGLFALHPVHVESVAWISAVTDLEVTFFYLLAFWCFLQVDNPRFGHGLLMHAAMGVCFLLALLSKEQALTLADAPGAVVPHEPQPVIMLTYQTSEAAIRAALALVERDGHVSSPPRFIRIETF